MVVPSAPSVQAPISRSSSPWPPSHMAMPSWPSLLHPIALLSASPMVELTASLCLSPSTSSSPAAPSLLAQPLCSLVSPHASSSKQPWHLLPLLALPLCPASSLFFRGAIALL
uniref:Uncharacterized protein n=1 Tax=Zea mays TaxID=4577 RepID=B8A0L7_MAIZE|nr:unknown [Zea mays]|eukprot:NP_001146337.1 uncharacterized protein LOC100279913 [Zea mays]